MYELERKKERKSKFEINNNNKKTYFALTRLNID